MENTGTAGHSLPAPPPPPPPTGTGVDLRVSRRLLWVGEAAYPLHNITRVHTFVLRPKRMEAFTSFLKWLGITFVAFVLLQMTSKDSAYDDGSANGSSRALLLLAVAVAIGLVVHLVKELSASSEHVLAVETSSTSTALVTLPNPDQLRQLVVYLVNAIENPEAEFQVRVERVLVNPKNYHFGDNVNMYGGLFNTGVSK
ncbi:MULTISPECIES: DUF6232 family protein [unclassified Streptomyces]|uniref:DUF6232 family protein n=1 Tax=unclassified Streptomyces TaxID=2593676 RepID=UPI0033D7B442